VLELALVVVTLKLTDWPAVGGLGEAVMFVDKSVWMVVGAVSVVIMLAVLFK
jgi:hypothetical protein